MFSAATASSYILYMEQGLAVGDLIGLAGREPDVAVAQGWGCYWLSASVFCLGVSSLMGAFAMPIYQEAARLPRFIARLVVASVASFVLAVLIGFVSFWVITASHRF